MEQSDSSTLPNKSSFDLNLTLGEIIGAVIGVIGYATLIISAKQDINEITGSQGEADMSAAPSQAPQTAAVASTLIAIANIILAEIAAERLRERKMDQQAGITAASIAPNVKLAFGSALSAIGNTIEALGAQERAAEPGAGVTII